MIKPIIGRVGGKWRISKWILEHIKRFEWSLYVEPFCGSSAIYFQLLNDGIPELIRSRGHHPRFVLNDMDSKIINLYRCCRDFPELLAYAVYFTPYSREEHRNAQKGEAVDDLIEMCNRYLVNNWQSEAKRENGGWGVTKNLYNIRDGETLEKVYENRPFLKLSDKILEVSKHLGERFQELREGIETIADESVRAKTQDALNAVLSEFQKTIESDLRIEFTRQYLVDGYQSFGATAENSWGTWLNTDKKTMGGIKNVSPFYFDYQVNRQILEASPHLQEISELKKVYLENDDFEKVCRRWDTKHSLHYIDPPYYGKEDYYSEKFTKECHQRLCQLVHELEGQVILSYYPHPDILAMYNEADWEFHFKETVASSAGMTKNSKTKTRPKRTELLLVRKNKNVEKKVVNLSGQLSLSL